jgi:hypothetical protein
MAGVVALQFLHISRATLGITDAVDQQRKTLQFQGGHELPANFYDVGVHRGVAVSQDLDTELVVLSKASGLRPLIAEDRAEIIKSHRLRKVVHTAFQISTTYRSGPLGSKCDGIPSPVLEGVHLFLNDVRTFTHRAKEEP